MCESTVSTNISRDSMLDPSLCKLPYQFRVMVGILPAATVSDRIELGSGWELFQIYDLSIPIIN